MNGAAAGWDRNASIDGKGIAILELWLNDDSKHRFLPSLNKKDTEPNYDGYITYGKPHGKKVSPIGRVIVQVKSTATSIENSNITGTLSQYKYECSTEVLFAGLQKVSQDPTGLIIVDTCKKRLYWISLTQDYLQNLDLKPGQKSKTLYFDDSEEMSDHDRFFDLLESLRAEHLKFHKTMTDNALLVSPLISRNKMIELQKASDVLNERCTTDLFFLKRCTFPTAWKMAIRYAVRNGKAYFGIVPLISGANNSVLLGNLNLRDDLTNPFCPGPITQSFEEDPFLTVCCDENKDLGDLLNGILSKWGNKFATTFMIPPTIMPDVMIEELFFWYADMLAVLIPGLGLENRPSLYPSDSFTPSQCRRLFEAPYYAGWKHWMDYAQYVDFDKQGIHFADPFSADSTVNNFEKSSCRIRRFLEDQSLTLENGFKIELGENDVPFQYIEQLVREIEDRDLTLHRPWRLSFPRRGLQDENDSESKAFSLPSMFDDCGCSAEDYRENLAKLYGSYVETREDVLTRFFGDCFPYDDLISRKQITIYIDENEFIESTECYSKQGIGVAFEIKPFSEYSSNWYQSLYAGNYENGSLESIADDSSAPFFTNAIPLYNLFEEDIISVLRRLFPGERFSALRKRDRYRFKKASGLSNSRILLMR